MTLTPYTLEDFGGGRLGWAALLAFVRNVGPESALYRATHPDESETIAWVLGYRNAALIADLIDQIQGLRYEHAKAAGGRPRKPKPYPRPWVPDEGAHVVGHEPIPVGEFEDWWAG